MRKWLWPFVPACFVSFLFMGLAIMGFAAIAPSILSLFTVPVILGGGYVLSLGLTILAWDTLNEY